MIIQRSFKGCGRRAGFGRWPIAIATLLSVAAWAGAVQAEVRRIEIHVAPGLQYDQVRFAVEPGQEVELTLTNPDEMQHNLLIVEPGAREEVAKLAVRLGADGPRLHFVPESDLVLFNTRLLYTGEKQTITFTAPEVEDVYPYVCTFPGHAAVMFGAMYVTTDPLPPLAEDPHIPEVARKAAVAAIGGNGREEPAQGHHASLEPQVRRTFVRDASPAAIAVHVGRGLSYVWDATTCQFRYAWKGGFVDSEAHWTGAGRDFSEIEGVIYYRAAEEFPIRIGDVSDIPEREFQGYSLIDGVPRFRYSVDGYNVREYITAPQEGVGLVVNFEIDDAPGPVYLLTDPTAGAVFEASAGTWEDGVLTLTALEAKSFTVRLRERPGHEPVRYWSMDDDPWGHFMDPHAGKGVVGQAVRFVEHGKRSGLRGKDLQAGMTFAAWARVEETETPDQVLLGAMNDTGSLVLGYNYDAVPGYSLTFATVEGDVRTVELASEGMLPAGEWNHLMFVTGEDGSEVYVNGQIVETGLSMRLPPEAEFQIGSLGRGNHFKGWLDEVRIWKRVVSDDELAAVYATEAANGGVK